MDSHPIPQNVTSFQFKLVGDMTLKQFMYLAAGSGMAYLLFLLLAPSYPIAGWPMVIISASLGAAFAFLPIQSRPLDHWVGAFLKAVYSPTKRVWKKNGKTFKEENLFNNRLMMYFSGNLSPAVQAAPPAGRPTASTQTVAVPLQPIQAPPPTRLPTREELQKTVELARQAQNLQMKIIQTERTLSQIKAQAQKPTPIPANYSQQVNKTLADLQTLVGQASTIKQQLETVTTPATPVTSATSAVTQESVKVVIPVKTKQAQVALTTFPNVISGIIKDRQENYLEGVVAVIYDKEGLPVRALKTNKLGQFTGSTPLHNGVYRLELEKEGYTFDVLQIELAGQILPSLIITAK